MLQTILKKLDIKVSYLKKTLILNQIYNKFITQND